MSRPARARGLKLLGCKAFMFLLPEKAASGFRTGGGFRVALFAAGMVALIVGYVELRVPVPVSAQGGDAVYNTLRTAIPIAPRYLGSGIPGIATYLRGDGVWAGVSPPTAVSWSNSLFTTSSTSYQDTGISITLDLPAATSDVLLNARIVQPSSCRGRILFGATVLQGVTSFHNYPVEYTVLHHDPGIGSRTYVFQARVNGVGPCQMNSGGGISVMIGQVLR